MSQIVRLSNAGLWMIRQAISAARISLFDIATTVQRAKSPEQRTRCRHKRIFSACPRPIARTVMVTERLTEEPLWKSKRRNPEQLRNEAKDLREVIFIYEMCRDSRLGGAADRQKEVYARISELDPVKTY